VLGGSAWFYVKGSKQIMGTPTDARANGPTDSIKSPAVEQKKTDNPYENVLITRPPGAAPGSSLANDTETAVSDNTQADTDQSEVIEQPEITVINQAFTQGMEAYDRGDLLIARETLNRSIQKGLPAEQLEEARQTMTRIAEETIFSRLAIVGDPLVDKYIVQRGDTMGKIAHEYKLTEDLLNQINGGSNKNFIRIGQSLKVLHGPFHATVVKSKHEIHLFLQDVYVRSYPVALGKAGSTPTGTWKVVDRIPNPAWYNPDTNEKVHADDPENPLGEFWIELEGIEGNAVGQTGFGIHGTIEPETIGSDVSLGCVRLLPDDIAEVYKFLVTNGSIVTIVN
jgi:hypothetical protein